MKKGTIMKTGAVTGPRTAEEIDEYFRERALLPKEVWKLEKASCTHFGIFSGPDEYIICAIYVRV